MIYMQRWKVITIIIITILGVLFALPNILSENQRKILPQWMQSTVNLGLELRGGSYLQLEVDLNSVTKEQLSGIVSEVRRVLRKEKIGYKNLRVMSNPSLISVDVVNTDQSSDAIKTLEKIDSDLTVEQHGDSTLHVSFSESAMAKRYTQIIDQSREVIRRRIDETGTKEPIIQRQGANRIVVQLPGINDPAEVKRLIGKTAKMSFHLVNNKAGDVSVNSQGHPVTTPPVGSMILPKVTRSGQTEYVVVYKKVDVSGENLVDAQATFENGTPAVSLKFNSIGGRQFAKVSSENVGKQFAIVLDGKILSDPVFREPILQGSGLISGHFTVAEANELSLLLRAGALPAQLDVVEERTVGPTLGADSIVSGKLATALSFVFVAAFMFITYGYFGLFANVALLFNVIFLFASLSLLGATLTLPGIAGIALTIGMAVDSNVLNFERIREELNAGLRPAMAIKAGYDRALTTIIDSHVTTLIGGAVLYEFGSGPIRGFAVTLSLGILISLFTAVSLTRLLVITWFNLTKPKTLKI